VSPLKLPRLPSHEEMGNAASAAFELMKAAMEGTHAVCIVIIHDEHLPATVIETSLDREDTVRALHAAAEDMEDADEVSLSDLKKKRS
jgi:hypothetical protein